MPVDESFIMLNTRILSVLCNVNIVFLQKSKYVFLVKVVNGKVKKNASYNLQIFKFTVEVCHSAQDVLPLPISEIKNKTKFCQFKNHKLLNFVVSSVFCCCVLPLNSFPSSHTKKVISSNLSLRGFQFWDVFLVWGIRSYLEKNPDVINRPQHSGEGGLSTSDEVAVTRDDQLCLFSVLFRNVSRLPVETNKSNVCIILQLVLY